MQTFCVRFPFRGFFISKNFYLSDNPMEFREILVTAFCQRLNAKVSILRALYRNCKKFLVLYGYTDL